MRIVAFNGPPGCGKDSVGKLLADIIEKRHDCPIKLESLSTPLRVIAYAMVGLKYDPYVSDAVNRYDDFKRQTFRFGGVNISGRQLMIDVSERFLKPVYGIGVMADMLIERNKLMTSNSIVIIRDSGFNCEVQPLIDAVGADNVYVVRLHREGTTFNNDSREWVYAPQDTDLYNDGSLEDLHTEATRIYGRLLNQLRWQL